MRLLTMASLLSLVSLPVLADEPLDLVTSLRTDFWSGSRNLDDVHGIGQASVWIRAKKNFGTDKLVVNGWLAGRTRHDGGPNGIVREFYWQHSAGSVELSIGRKLIMWGRTDGFNPTDNLAPRDYTLLVPDDNDQRHGNEVVALKYETGFGDLSALYFPRSASSTIPVVSQPGVRYTHDKQRQSQWAFRWEVSGDFDASVSYFRGVDLIPDLTLSQLTASGANIALTNNSIRVLGGDVSFTRGGIVWRAEMAAMQTDSDGGYDFAHKKPQVWAVVGGEATVADNTTLTLQGVAKRVHDFVSPDAIADPNQRAVAWRQAATSDQWSRTELGFMWILASRLRNGTLLLETSGAYFGGSDSGVVRAKIDYAYNDSQHLELGARRYFGAEHSFLGQLKKNSLFYLQARFTM